MEDKRIGSRLRDLSNTYKIQTGKVSTKHRAGFYEYEPRYLEVVCKSMRGVKNEGKMSGVNFNKYV